MGGPSIVVPGGAVTLTGVPGTVNVCVAAPPFTSCTPCVAFAWTQSGVKEKSEALTTTMASPVIAPHSGPGVVVGPTVGPGAGVNGGGDEAARGGSGSFEHAAARSTARGTNVRADRRTALLGRVRPELPPAAAQG
jgi:hypothetical protein